MSRSLTQRPVWWHNKDIQPASFTEVPFTFFLESWPRWEKKKKTAKPETNKCLPKIWRGEIKDQNQCVWNGNESVWDSWKREKKKDRRGGGCKDGLSRDRLTEVMREEDESEEHDSRIQIQSRLTLLEYGSFSKSSYPTHRTLTPLLLFSTGLPSQYILPYLFSCYLFSVLSSLTPYIFFLSVSFQGLWRVLYM